MATLMNTRGLTELIILSVGLQIGVLDQSLYSIMVLMAVITTAIAGPLLRIVYPRRMVERDQAVDAEPVVEPAARP
jgi:Kef-type K+ transport system membrane component KefB